MNDPRGSIWRKWDLHVHTPASIVQSYGNNDDKTWEQFITDLEKLPAEFKAIGISDYNFIDGYIKVVDAKKAGRLKNIDLILPVVELRIDKFGGSENKIRRVNLHVIFSEDLKPEVIQTQFLNALEASYKLTPPYASKGIEWSGTVTIESLRDLGHKIIESVPQKERAKFGSPVMEGFNNLDLPLDKVLEKLKANSFLKGNYLLAVGKTEWASIEWNDSTIAEKKNIINNAHFVFTSSENPSDFKKAKKALHDGGVNDRLLDCSDAHSFSESKEKDRIGNCFMWIKGDTCFETLKQAFCESEYRLCGDANQPFDPIYKISKVTFDFPEGTTIEGEDFCLRGHTDVHLSPNLTCLIGGRGTGKSMVLNLLHERLQPDENLFLKEHLIQNAKVVDCVQIEGATNVEFLSQNEIEEFATNQDKFTLAIFNRLLKLDKEGHLEQVSQDLDTYLGAIDLQISRMERKIKLEKEISEKKKVLESYRDVIGVLQDADYLTLSADVRKKSERLQELQSSSKRLAALIASLQKILMEFTPNFKEATNGYQVLHAEIIKALTSIVAEYKSGQRTTDDRKEETLLSEEIKNLQESLESLLNSKGVSEENLLDITRANQMFSGADAEVKTLEAEMVQLKSDIAGFSINNVLRHDYESEFSSQLNPVVEKLSSLSGEVKPIGLEYRFDIARAKDALLEIFLKHLPTGTKGRRYRKDYVSDTLFLVNPESLPSKTSFLQQITETKGDAETATAIASLFQNDDQYEIYKLEAMRVFADANTYKSIMVSYDNRPLKNSSFGQRCTAAIVILLLLGNTPLIIDEPEAHLDSSLIARYLVDLIKRQKQLRQIVFATHNANFVVNGDAELINALEMDAAKRTAIVPTTIENLAFRDKIVALEGGKEAFKRREEKYEFISI